MSEIQPYPSYRDHVDGRSCLVQTAEEDAALGEGWSARGTVVHQPTDEEAAAAAIADGSFQPYPSWRHHVSGTSTIVASEEEDAALGEGWYPNADEARRAAAGVAGPTNAGTASRPVDPAEARLAEERAAFHATPANRIAESLSHAQAENVEDIRVLRTWEVAHPKFPGGRKGVLEAIDARIVELTAPLADPPPTS